MKRVAFFGNVTNLLFQMARILRESGEIEAHLFLDLRDDLQTRPESDDERLRGNLPDWIHEGHYVTARSLAFPARSQLVQELEGFDLVIVAGFGPTFLPYLSAPSVFYVTGGDLTRTPFPLRFFRSHPRWKTRIGLLPAGFRQRRGIRAATTIVTQPFFPFTTALDELRVPDHRRNPNYVPLVFDPEPFDIAVPVPAGADASQLRKEHDFVLFHPARLMIQDDPNMRRTGQWKGNDVLVRAFAKFVSAQRAAAPVLVMIDRDASPDRVAIKDLIAELGIESNVKWLQPPTAAGFPRADLINYYKVADVVADDFGIGWFGSIVLEGLAASKPVLNFVDEDAMSKLYPWHPLLSSRDIGELATWMARLFEDAAFRSSTGATGRQWIEQFHSPQLVSGAVTSLIRGLLDPETDSRSATA